MLYPMFLMVLLTFIVGCIALRVRFSNVKNGSMSIKYFKLMDGENVPEMVTKTSRHFNNQFEIPTLFYVVCTLYITFGIDSFIAVVVAWFFVFFRFAHSYIHLTYNHILHSILTFWAGFICVMVLWINLLAQKV